MPILVALLGTWMLWQATGSVSMAAVGGALMGMAADRWTSR